MLSFNAAILFLLVSVAAGQSLNCDIGNPGALSYCLKNLLNAARSRIKAKADPLTLPNQNNDGVEVWNTRVYGLSNYNVEDLAITFPHQHKIAVDASIVWPVITADLTAKVRKCKRIIKKLCAQATGDVRISMGRTVGTLSTTLNFHVGPNGKLSITPVNTQVRLSLPKIHVKISLKSKVGKFFNRILGDPVSRIATKLTNKWWGKNRSKIETKAKNAFNEAIREDVSPKLENLLKVR